MLKTTAALVAFGSLLIGATASPIEVPAGSVPEGSYPADSVPNNVPAKTDENADTWFIWSDSSRTFSRLLTKQIFESTLRLFRLREPGTNPSRDQGLQ